MINNDRLSGNSDDNESDLTILSMGTLVIRTWHASDQTPSFRARVTYGKPRARNLELSPLLIRTRS